MSTTPSRRRPSTQPSRARRPTAITDGGGLFVEILPSGSKVCRFKYHLDCKREKVTIGAYPAARDKHEEMRSLVEQGEGPARGKKVAAVEKRLAVERAMAFRVFAPRWVDETIFYRSASYRAQIIRWLDAHVYPESGKTVAAYSHMDLEPECWRALQFLADQVDRAAARAEVIAMRACA